MVAHRGASDELPEHTLAAYAKAIADGADALECDVRLTADGHLVCVHDPALDRTSDGRGLVSHHALDALAELDFWTWKAATAPDTGQPPERGVLTLRRLLELVAETGGRVGLAVEIKDPPPDGRVERALLRELGAFGWTAADRPGGPEIRVMSFSRASLRRIGLLAPGLTRVWLLHRVPHALAAGAVPYGADVLGPGIDVVRADAAMVRRWTAAGHRVHVWTVDDPADLAVCVDVGAEAVITNRPGWALARLAGPAGAPPRRPCAVGAADEGG